MTYYELVPLPPREYVALPSCEKASGADAYAPSPSIPLSWRIYIPSDEQLLPSSYAALPSSYAALPSLYAPSNDPRLSLSKEPSKEPSRLCLADVSAEPIPD